MTAARGPGPGLLCALAALAAAICLAECLPNVALVAQGGLVNPDSTMRLVRLQQALAAGGRADVIQADASGQGMVLYWSHLLDLAILALRLPLLAVLPPDAALRWAAACVGPLSVAAAGAACAWASAPLAARRWLWAGPVCLATSPLFLSYGQFGCAHHHVAVAAACIMVAGCAGRARGGALGAGMGLGVWSGLGIWLTPEALPFALLGFGLLGCAARRQRGLAEGDVPAVCLLDPDGDLARRLRQAGRSRACPSWACYHTELDRFGLGGREVGIVGRAVGAPFAVLVAEQLFASGCRLLVSLTSAGQIVPAGATPYFVVIDRALRDEGTSYHYAAPADYAEADPRLVSRAAAALGRLTQHWAVGASWTTDAPYRETEEAIAAARARGILAVEMEAAALYAFSAAGRSAGTPERRVLCLAHVTNTMAVAGDDFEKGEADGTADALAVLGAIVDALAGP